MFIYSFFAFSPQGRKKAAGRRRWARKVIWKKKKKEMMEDKRRHHVCSEVEEDWRRKKKIWTLNFLNFSYADAPYCYTDSHTCIYHMHTTSVHPYHQLWFVALCCIVMMFATLRRNNFNRKNKHTHKKKLTLVNSLLCLFHVLLLCLLLTGGML